MVAEPKAQRPKEVSSDQTSPAEEESKPVVGESKKPTWFVIWKADQEIFNIPKTVPVKAARSRKSKLDNNNENKEVSNAANMAKEEELPGEVVQTLPAKRSRPGVHTYVTVASTNNRGLKEHEPQQKSGEEEQHSFLSVIIFIMVLFLQSIVECSFGK